MKLLFSNLVKTSCTRDFGIKKYFSIRGEEHFFIDSKYLICTPGNVYVKCYDDELTSDETNKLSFAFILIIRMVDSFTPTLAL